MFELGARPHPPRALYRSYLAQSDVFVGIYGDSYGWVAPDEQISGLEDEYNLAPASMPKLIYIKASDHRDDRLEELIARIQTDDTAAYLPFETAERARGPGRRRPRDPPRRALRAVARAVAATTGAGRRALARRARARPVHDARSAASARLAEVRDLLARGERPGRQPDRTRRDRQEPPRDRGRRSRPRPVPRRHRTSSASRTCSSPRCCSRRSPTPSASATTAKRALEERISRALAGRRVLIVLDNFEQIVDAAPVLVAALHARTDRELPRDQPHRAAHPRRAGLRGAAADDAGARRPRHARARAAVRRRWRCSSTGPRPSKPVFALTEENAAAVMDICRRLDGLPLAIELAAAKLRMLTPAGIAAAPRSTACRCSTAAVRDLPDRHRTMRATIDWSVGLLSPRGPAICSRTSASSPSGSRSRRSKPIGAGPVVGRPRDRRAHGAHRRLARQADRRRRRVRALAAGDRARVRARPPQGARRGRP